MKTKSILAITIIALMMLTLIPANVSFAIDVTKYTVTFETNGGSKVDAVEVAEMSCVPLPEKPTKEGFVFGGWYTDAECEYKFFIDEPITADKILYANWVTADKVIDTINLTMTEPEIGDTINEKTKIVVTAETGANYEIYPGYFITAFPTKGEGYDEPYEGKFENDKDYYFEFEYMAKEGYIFADALTITINGTRVDFETNEFGLAYVKINIESENKGSSNEGETASASIVAEDTDDAEDVAAAKEVASLVDEVIAGKEVEGIDEETVTNIITAKMAGKDVKADLSKEEVSKEDVAEDAEKVAEKLEEKEEIAAYYDVNVLVKAGQDNIGKVTKLKNKVTLKLPIPEKFKKAPNGYERIFSVIKVHKGVASKINAESDGENVSVESDEFSTYVLTYTDTKITSNPKTGDMISISVAMFVLTAAGVIVVAKKFNK